jgi:hypothetical protein
MLLDAAALAPPPEPDVAAAHAQALAFLESVAKDPYAAFAAVRAAQLTVEGEEEAVRAAARALIGLGVGTVTTSEGDGLRIGAVEAVLGRDAIVGRRAAEALGCWTGRGDVDFSGPCGPLVARLAGNVAAYQAFRELSGLAQNAAEVTVVRAAGLETTIHPVRPPGPGVPDEDPGAEAFLDALDPLLDPLFGLLEAPQPGELPQLPLRLAAVGDRLGFAAGGAEARRRALLAAAAPSGAGGCAGVTVTGWLADGLLRLALGGDLDGASEPVAPGDVDAVGRTCWQALVRWDLDPVVTVAPSPRVPGAHVAIVAADRTLARGAGRSPAGAASTALQAAAAGVQANAGGGGRPELADAGDDVAAWVAGVREALGEALDVRIDDREPMLREHGLVTGWVTLRDAGA